MFHQSTLPDNKKYIKLEKLNDILQLFSEMTFF